MFIYWNVIAKNKMTAKRSGTKLNKESSLATENTTDRVTTPIKRSIGKSKGVLLILRFWAKKLLIP